MISKESFSRLIAAIEHFHILEQKLYKLIDISPESPLFDLSDCVVDVIENELNDNMHLISDYCYNRDFGKSYQDTIKVYDLNTKEYNIEEDYLAAIDGVKYRPCTPEELYDLMLKLNKK